jgi:hypothetical protein
MLDAQILHGKASLYTVAYEHSYTNSESARLSLIVPGHVAGYPEPGTTVP